VGYIVFAEALIKKIEIFFTRYLGVVEQEQDAEQEYDQEEQEGGGRQANGCDGCEGG